MSEQHCILAKYSSTPRCLKHRERSVLRGFNRLHSLCEIETRGGSLPAPFSEDAPHCHSTRALVVSANRKHNLKTRPATASATRLIYNSGTTATATAAFLDCGQKEAQGSTKPCLFADAGAGNTGATQPAAAVHAASNAVSTIIRQEGRRGVVGGVRSLTASS